MEILIGRITADAKVNTLKDERKVVNFSIAINDSYKKKGTEQVKKVVTFVNCSFWIGEGIAKHLTKGTLVEVAGHISVSAYNDLEGEPRASLNFHVNNIKLHGKSSSQQQVTENVPVSADAGTKPINDLPF
ncbi:MAG TPA: single-stranded DNA-binding protein [Puia sp.]|nr:single-stranded DNA-binding protein [Puia sp.]